MGAITTLVLLLAILAGAAQADERTPTVVIDIAQGDSTPLACLALVGGTALLAGTVWLGMLRRIG